MSNASDYGDMIERSMKTIEQGNALSEGDVIQILMKISEVLTTEPNVLVLQSPITICGDIHGQFDDLAYLFEATGNKDKDKYLFMGDYVDRGKFSLNTFIYLCCLKLKYPNNYFLLRGNHESRQVNQMYGFLAECTSQFGHSGIWMLCNGTFDLLPMAALIDHEIFAVHGGISPDMPYISKVSTYDRNDELPPEGPLCDLCWSDPENVKKWVQNTRGAGYIFGSTQIKHFVHINHIKLVTRSHQLAMKGYQWFFTPNPNASEEESISMDEPLGPIITVWSAPNYMYRSNNKASVMRYNYQDGRKYELKVFEECKQRLEPKDTSPDISQYFA